jgi:hypothetical protein
MKANTLPTIALGIFVGIMTTGIAAADDIVLNGSFELPAVDNPENWDIFDSIPGWGLLRGPKIELQRGVNGWLPADGDQYIELDSDLDGPGGGMHGEPASSAVFQDLVTSVGQEYELTFAFSPRPGVADNALEIKWDGTVVDTLSADGTGLSNTDWQYYSYELTAAAELSRLEFGDLSVSDSLGTFVDDVSVVAVPEPASLCVLLTAAALLLRRGC